MGQHRIRADTSALIGLEWKAPLNYHPTTSPYVTSGVFGDDEVKRVSVKEGESFLLNSDLTEIKDDDEIQWKFEYYEETLIAEINKRADRIAAYDDVLAGRFRDRLKLNNQTGSLTITNIIPEHIGYYSLQINGVREKKFSVDIQGWAFVSVKEGESFFLNSDLTEIKDDDVIQWRFEYYEETLIAEINKRADRIAVYDDVLDGRFRDRLKLNNQTGSLTITNITTEHAGYYSLQINSVREKKFSVDIQGSVTSVSVKEGESLTLNSLTDMKDNNYMIRWMLGDEDTLIAEINKRADRIAVYDDVLDGRFRDRLKLNNQTGSLTITNIRPEHAGDYKRQMSQYSFSSKAFRVSVSARLPVPVISKDCSSSSSPSGSHPNPISNQTQHLNITQLCHTCSGTADIS
ncbi:uncharacterized protein LOC143723145 [Siphateles boraxobius]|uniref:uncharacterized protein LOC143723145 n=1 Tax=Siphateles boraxobius TaxID=180520 RepID=UPI00406390C4